MADVVLPHDQAAAVAHEAALGEDAGDVFVHVDLDGAEAAVQKETHAVLLYRLVADVVLVAALGHQVVPVVGDLQEGVSARERQA